MGYRIPVLIGLIVLNLFAFLVLRKAVVDWVGSPRRRRRVVVLIASLVVLLNLPLVPFFLRDLDQWLVRLPAGFLRLVYFPASVWVQTLMLFALITFPVMGYWIVRRATRWLRRSRSVPPADSETDAESEAGSGAEPGAEPGNMDAQQFRADRRRFVTGSAGLLVPALYGVAALSRAGVLDELEISPERAITIPDLPRSLDGLSVVQISDLHAGPYIREKDLQYVVSQVNALHPDLIAITGDILDRRLESLPGVIRGLAGLKSSLGAYAILGNHDISADRFSYTPEHRGGVHIADGLRTLGIRTLRNEVTHLGTGADQLALMGLDWLAPRQVDSLFRYDRERTLAALGKMNEEVEPGVPKLLLAHHPDTFTEAVPYGIGLTLSGHTHGGGQILLGHFAGVPFGLAMLRFRYLSGLYREQGCSLYVNRGIGYLGVPIRINCPPEISRFRLTAPVSA